MQLATAPVNPICKRTKIQGLIIQFWKCKDDLIKENVSDSQAIWLIKQVGELADRSLLTQEIRGSNSVNMKIKKKKSDMAQLD